MDAEQLRAILAGGESSTVEFKIKAPRPAELAERMCGMANTRAGGMIVFGVEDRTGRVVGVSAVGDTIDAIHRAARLVRPRVALVTAEPLTVTIDDLTIVVAQIAANGGELHQAGGISWIRRGTHTVAMSNEEIWAHINAYGSSRWESSPCARATLADIDEERVERYLSYRAERSRRKMRYTSAEDLLVGLECAVRDPATGQIRPTNAGMLLFGIDPQLQIPQSEVVCIKYADDLGVRRYIDRKNFSGTLPELIDKTADFLKQYVRVGATIRGFKREDEPEYPLEALREAVVNAIVHRDYSEIGQTVRVFVYANRVEVHSPGQLLPGITVEALREMRVASRPRNPLIAQFLRDIPGYMERVGSGIRLMINEMRQMGLPDPEFIEQHEFVVVFRNGAEELAAQVGELNERQRIGLQLIRERGSISTGEYCAATGAAQRTAFRDLQDLVERGVIVSRGKKRGSRYYLP